MARKSKLTPELIKQCRDLVAVGASIKDTCKIVELGETTWHRWISEADEMPPLTEEEISLASEIEINLETGVSRKQACKGAGIGEKAYTSILKRQFRDSVQKGDAEGVAFALTQLRAHMRKQWTAAAWFLEAKRPEEFGAKRRQGGSTDLGEDDPIHKMISEIERLRREEEEDDRTEEGTELAESRSEAVGADLPDEDGQGSGH